MSPAPQVTVNLGDLQASRNRRLVPPVLNPGNGCHPLTVVSQQAPYREAHRVVAASGESTANGLTELLSSFVIN